MKSRFGGSGRSRSKIAAAIAVVVSIPFFVSTFAASVTVGTGATSFTMTGSATIAGAFVTNASSGTSGVLFAEGDFTGGDKSVTTGDSLAVTYTFSLTAS